MRLNPNARNAGGGTVDRLKGCGHPCHPAEIGLQTLTT